MVDALMEEVARWEIGERRQAAEGRGRGGHRPAQTAGRRGVTHREAADEMIQLWA